jgi:predicted lipid-binding transport protein (Tim44 family)
MTGSGGSHELPHPARSCGKMNGIDITTLLFLVIAVAVILRLRSVLGRRTGNERPRYDPFSAQDAGGGAGPSRDNVVTLPRSEGRPLDEADARRIEDERLKDVAPRDSELGRKLAAILRADSSFEPSRFLEGAKTAYEMTVTAFAEGNRRLLKQLLSREVYDSFAGAIADRERNGETVEFSFVGINKVEIVDAELIGDAAHVTVKFLSELITATHDRNGAVLEGDPKKIREVTDIWTFARRVSSRDPNWKLVATETAN